MNQDLPQNVVFLKRLVIGLGIAIVIATAILLVGLYVKSKQLVEEAEPDVPSEGLATFDTSRIALPNGARLVDAQGVGDRLILRLDLAEGGQAVLLVDMRTGKRLGLVELAPAQ